MNNWLKSVQFGLTTLFVCNLQVSSSQVLLEKEPYTSKSPTDLATVELLNLRFYEPDLFAFEVHCRNHLCSIYSALSDSTMMVIDWPSFRDLCYGVLLVYSQIQLSPLYRRKGIIVDGKSKLLAVCLNNMEVPKWLLDLCREVARPMVSNTTVFVPWIRPRANAAAPARPELGIGASQASQVLAWLRGLPLPLAYEFRSIVEEAILSAPLAVRDGEFVFIDPATATWRRKAVYGLLHLYNGVTAARHPNVALRDAANVQVAAWVPTRITLDAFNEVFTDCVDLPEAIADPANVGQALLDAVNNSDHQGKIWLFIGGNRVNTYSDWLSRARSAGALLPPPEKRVACVRGMLELQVRYPTDEMHSRTPPQSPTRGDLGVLKLGGKRGRGKGGTVSSISVRQVPDVK